MYLYPSKPSPAIRPLPSDQTLRYRLSAPLPHLSAAATAAATATAAAAAAATAMPDIAVHDLSSFDPFTTVDPSFFDEGLLPADVHFSLDSADALDLDLDLDVGFDGDFLSSFLNTSPDTASPPPDAPPRETTSPPPNVPPPGISAISSNRTPADQSVPTSPESATSVVANPEEDRTATAPKRKRYTDPIPNPNPKFQRPEETNSSSVFTPGDNEDDKRKVRLMRNRESAQLSRQRKKHYVEELEDKVKAMQTTITDLNNRVSYFMAENASLRQQLGVKGPPPAAVYPPPVHYPPWIPGYAYRPPPGSHVPLVPIPRIKTQQPAPALKVRKSGSKKGESKSTAKKVAGVSLLGLMFIILIFGGVLPMINFMSSGSVVKDGIVSHPHMSVSGRSKSGNNTDGIGVYSGGFGVNEKHAPDARVTTQNSSEAIPALLYVPRNGKHVKIDGNLIIHSVVASEKALKEKSLREKAKQSTAKERNETSLAISGNIASALAISQAGKYRSSVEQQRDAYADSLKSTPVDGPLQQWFREGLAGPILNSGMCTEVFHFDVSPSAHPGGIVPASAVVNGSENIRKSGSGKIRNRRILYPQRPIPIAGSILNDTEQVGGSSANDSFRGNNAPVPSMVVSVLADPREVGDGDGEGMMSPKSLSRVFVVVLLDSVKYVTYSCVLPFKSSSPHLV